MYSTIEEHAPGSLVQLPLRKTAQPKVSGGRVRNGTPWPANTLCFFDPFLLTTSSVKIQVGIQRGCFAESGDIPSIVTPSCMYATHQAGIFPPTSFRESHPQPHVLEGAAGEIAFMHVELPPPMHIIYMSIPNFGRA